MNDLDIGKLNVPVEANLAGFDRAVKQDLPRRARQAGREAAAELSRGMGESRGKSGRQGGENLAKEFLAGVKLRFERDRGDAAEALARGLIDRKEFERRGREAAKAFDDAVLSEIQRRGRAGRLNDTTFVSLTKSLKTVTARSAGESNDALAEQMRRGGERAGRALGEGIERETRGPLDRLVGWVRTGVLVYLTQEVIGAIRSIGAAAAATIDRARDATRAEGDFDRIARGRGMDPAAVLRLLQQETRNTVRAQDLMRQSSKLLNSDLQISQEEIAELAAIARRLWPDAADGFDRFTRAILKGETELLDELQIYVRLDPALGIVAQRQQLLNDVLQQGRARVAGLTGELDPHLTSIDRARAAWENWKDAAAQAVANSPSIVSFLQSVGDTADGSASNLQRLANQLGALIDTAARLPEAFRNVSFRPGEQLDDLLRTGYNQALARRNALSDIEGMSDVSEVRLLLSQLQSQRIQLEREQQRRAQGGRAPAPRNGAPSPSAARDPEAALEGVLEKIGAAERRLAALQTPAAKPPPVRDPKEQDRLRRLREEQEQIAEDMESALAGLTASAVDDAILQLDRLEAHATKTFGTLPAALREGFARRREAVLADAQLEEFRRELDALAAAGATPGANAALDAHLARVQEYIAAHEEAGGALEEGTAARESYRQHLVAVTRQLSENERAIREEAKAAEEAERKKREDLRRTREERIRDLREQARHIEENVRAALQLAEAFGAVDAEIAQSVQSAAQLAAAVVRIAGGDLSAIPSAIGAFASILTARRRSEEEEQRRIAEVQRALLDQLERNREALERNTQAIAAGQTTGRITAGQAAGGDLATFLRSLRNGGSDKDLQKLLLEDPARREQLRQVGEATGIDLVAALEESLRLKDRTIFGNALKEALAILEQSAEHFGQIADSNVSGQMERFRRELELLDFDTPAEQLKHFDSFLRRIGAGGFADQLQGFLEKGDIAGAREFVRTLFQQLLSGGLSATQVAGMFGPGVTPEMVQDILSQINGWLEEVGAGATGSADSYSVSRSVTEVTGNRLFAAFTTGNFWAEQTARNTAAIAAALGARGLAQLPAVTPPSAAEVLGGGDVHLHLHEGAVRVDLPATANARDPIGAGTALGQAFVRSVDEAMGRELRRKQRRQGRNIV